jgi:hypothetical protein
VRIPIRPPAALALATALISVAACQQSPTHTGPPASHGLSLHCAKGDAAETNDPLGWGFCFPSTWRTLGGPKTQKTDAPKGVDTVYDITDFAPGPNNGLFGVIIISTDERGSASSLQDWIDQNVQKGLNLQPAQWGNATEALQEVGGQHPRWFALTAHHVVILELHSGQGNLDLNAAMAPRLNTWKFTY